MSNKIFTIGDTPQYDKNLIRVTYKDISIVSKKGRGKTKYEITSGLDVEAVKISMRNLFNFLPGERILDPEYGNTILEYLYHGINEYTKEQIVATIQNLVSRYEPRAAIDSLEDVSSISDHENNTIQLKIVWHVIGLDEMKYVLMVGV